MGKKSIETKAREAISEISQRLIDNRRAIELLTLTKGYKSIFSLKDDDWVRLTGYALSSRASFEIVARQERVADLLELAFSVGAK